MTFILSLLEGVKDGLSQSEIAKKHNTSRSLVSYFCKRLIQIYYLKKIGSGATGILELTQPGQNFLDQYSSCQNLFRLENIRFKAAITNMPSRSIDWKKVQLNNWIQYISIVDEVKVRLNVGKSPTIEFIPSPVEGSDPYYLRDKELDACKAAAKKIQESLEVEIGELEVSSRAEYVVYSSLAKEISKSIGQIDVKGIGKLNSSRPHRRGEFEFEDPRTALEFITIVDRVRILEKRVCQLELEHDLTLTQEGVL